MNQEDIQKKVARLGREVSDWLGNLSEEDLAQIEGKVDQFLGMMQKEYGWTAARAKQELEGYLAQYRGRTQDVVDRTLDSLNARFHSSQKRKKSRAGGWLWLAYAVGVFVVAWQVIQPSDI
jgi:uncharacterized protein YjbJ (UPF0337 family)